MRNIKRRGKLGAIAVAAVAGCALAVAVGGASGQSGGPSGPYLTTNSPIVWDFVQVGTSSSPQAAVLTNSGTGVLTILKVTPPSVPDFKVTSDQCTGKALTAGLSCKVYLVFIPTKPGTRVGDLTISDSRGTCVNYVTLAGSGTSTPPPASSADCVVAGQTTTVNKTTTTTVNHTIVQTLEYSTAPCSKREVKIHVKVPSGDPILLLKLFIDGKLVKTKHGGSLDSILANLGGKARGRHQVNVVALTEHHKKLKTKHFFVTCVPG